MSMFMSPKSITIHIFQIYTIVIMKTKKKRDHNEKKKDAAGYPTITNLRS